LSWHLSTFQTHLSRIFFSQVSLFLREHGSLLTLSIGFDELFDAEVFPPPQETKIKVFIKRAIKFQ
jgi:hypothetical protein